MFHIIDIYTDHKSNSSGLLERPTIKDCAYCNEIPKERRVFYKNDNFYVFPTYGEFIKGYLLIVPKEHVMSNAELSTEKRQEFLTVLEDISYILTLTYGAKDFLVWENGTGENINLQN